jgi:hypothetical protein
VLLILVSQSFKQCLIGIAFVSIFNLIVQRVV